MSATLPRIGLIDERARLNSIPINVLFELTHRCNAKCFHCYVVPQREQELDTHEVKRALDELAEAGALFVTFTGGEIMLRHDLYEIVMHARSLHFAVRLFTNGTLIDEEAADRIAELRPVDVGISIYGASAKTHELVTRIPGSFDRSVWALRLLRERGIYTHLKCVLMAENAGERKEIGDLADELGAHVQFDPQLTPKNNGDTSPLDHRMAQQVTASIVSAAPLEGELDLDCPPCGAGRDMVTISPSGEVLPCVQWPRSFGSLRESPFSELWRGPKASEARSFTISQLAGCLSCNDLGYCSPCLGLNYVETGDVSQPSPSVCAMARARREGAAAWARDAAFSLSAGAEQQSSKHVPDGAR